MPVVRAEGPGAFRRGARSLAREAWDRDLSIAQFGSTRSINASAAAAIVMHAWVRQHADLTGSWRG
jgi:tRNA G18 (ribose-2'-O)-methylase SpoU